MLIDRENWKAHRNWFAFAALLSLSAIRWFAVASVSQSRLVGGGSLPGIVFGVVGGLICLFEFLLWPRKRYRAVRVGLVQTWMKAHIWLGLASLPILILHSGFRLGGSLSTILMLLFLVVIASGVWGLWVQNAIPKKMLADIQAETIHSQIGRIIGQYHDEAGRLVTATCGREASVAKISAEGASRDDGNTDDAEESTHHMVVGAVRSAGKISGKVLQTRVVTQVVAGSEPLRAFYESVAGPFLKADGFRSSPLRRLDRSAVLFSELKTKLDPKAHPAADSLQNLCDQRRQLAEQDRLHRMLHGWLLIHLPCSVALIFLMVVHAFYALMYL